MKKILTFTAIILIGAMVGIALGVFTNTLADATDVAPTSIIEVDRVNYYEYNGYNRYLNYNGEVRYWLDGIIDQETTDELRDVILNGALDEICDAAKALGVDYTVYLHSHLK